MNSLQNMAASTRLLHLIHIVSPSLPVGAYAYSNGQEYAVESGWLNRCEDIGDWVSGILEHSIAELDLPVLIRFYNAWKLSDNKQLNKWNNFLRANRETKELLMEDEQMGMALQRLLIALGIDEAETVLDKPVCYSCMFALAGFKWQIPLLELTQGLAWSWLENQVAAATKTIPLGQTQAQKILLKTMEKIPQICRYAQTVQDQNIGAGLPALAIASARHERQYSRLFRS